jgi:hypothetical protein
MHRNFCTFPSIIYVNIMFFKLKHEVTMLVFYAWPEMVTNVCNVQSWATKIEQKLGYKEVQPAVFILSCAKQLNVYSLKYSRQMRKYRQMIGWNWSDVCKLSCSGVYWIIHLNAKKKLFKFTEFRSVSTNASISLNKIEFVMFKYGVYFKSFDICFELQDY